MSRSIPGTGIPTVDGFNFIPGNTDNIAPPISVPPDKFIIGIFLFPTFSKSHHHESSSSGSPVVGIFCNVSKEYFFKGSALIFLNNLTAVGDIPNIVALCLDNISHTLSELGKSSAPS